MNFRLGLKQEISSISLVVENLAVNKYLLYLFACG